MPLMFFDLAWLNQVSILKDRYDDLKMLFETMESQLRHPKVNSILTDSAQLGIEERIRILGSILASYQMIVDHRANEQLKEAILSRIGYRLGDKNLRDLYFSLESVWIPLQCQEYAKELT